MRKRNRKNLKKWLRRKPLWFTVVCATAAGITEIVRLLVGERSINMRDTSEKTLLMVSVQSENLHLAEYLIGAGCDPSATDMSGKTALDYAMQTGNEKMILLLLSIE